LRDGVPVGALLAGARAGDVVAKRVRAARDGTPFVACESFFMVGLLVQTLRFDSAP
jgi:hypothetical protein